ncbi:Dephospho-CoA kinase, partial [Coemansia sp. RSA 2703]
HFGTSILQTPGGAIDRAKLGAVIFNDSEKRQLLNRCTHPFVRRRILWQLFCNYARGHAVCVLDVPLLYEAGMHRMCAKVVVVACAREVQVERLMERNGLSREEAVARVDAQMPVEDKAKRADAVVNNEGSMEEMQEEVCRVVRAWHPAPWRVAGALLAPVIGLGALCAWAVAKVLGRM